MRNVATSEQEDDLEHTGHTYFSHSQRQPAHLNRAGAQARGTSRASSPWIHLKCYSCRQMSPQALLWAWFCDYRCLLLENWTICLYQLGGWHESCQWQGTAYLSRILAILCTAPTVGETKTSRSWRPYGPSNNTA